MMDVIVKRCAGLGAHDEDLQGVLLARVIGLRFFFTFPS